MVHAYNVFRILADLTHTGSKGILIFAICANQSAEGVSLLTQFLYILVFLTRYIDLLWVDPASNIWNFFFKVLYILTSFLIVFLMLRVFPRTREKEGAWKLAGWSLLGCIVATPLVNLIVNWLEFSMFEYMWIFSLELESVCILPQLLLLRQTSVPTVLDSYYLVALGSYRLLYILNWIVKGASGEQVEATPVVFGVIQTLFYVDFAWVYYSRQRVKLRGGSVVDPDDLGKSFLVKRLIGTKSKNPEDDVVDDEDAALANQEHGTVGPSTRNTGNRWGVRGISISADDTLQEHDKRGAVEISDPAYFEDDDEDDPVAPAPPAKDDPVKSGIASSAHAWTSETGRGATKD